MSRYFEEPYTFATLISRANMRMQGYNFHFVPGFVLRGDHFESLQISHFLLDNQTLIHNFPTFLHAARVAQKPSCQQNVDYLFWISVPIATKLAEKFIFMYEV